MKQAMTIVSKNTCIYRVHRDSLHRRWISSIY